MTDTTITTDTQYKCPYCRMQSAGGGSSCPNCGAPVDVRLRTTASGWTEMPPIADMARIQLGQSSCQIEGRLVPVAELKLAADDNVYFPHPSLLWQEPSVTVAALPMAKAWSRLRAGLPLVMLEARGPGRIAFSHDKPGELICLPIQAGGAVDVREHQMVLATGAVGYDWYESGVYFVTSGGRSSQNQGSGLKLLKMGLDVVGMATDDDVDAGGDETEWHYPMGRYIDRFVAGDRPGAVFVQVGGNAFVRDLADGETILVKPPALLFKDPSVRYQLHVEFPAAGVKLWRTWGNRYLWLRLWGPGRVGLQSCYDRLEDPGTDFRDSSQYTQQLWT
jgi:uncharacterized protein (AIM24 family)